MRVPRTIGSSGREPSVTSTMLGLIAWSDSSSVRCAAPSSLHGPKATMTVPARRAASLAMPIAILSASRRSQLSPFRAMPARGRSDAPDRALPSRRPGWPPRLPPRHWAGCDPPQRVRQAEFRPTRCRAEAGQARCAAAIAWRALSSAVSRASSRPVVRLRGAVGLGAEEIEIVFGTQDLAHRIIELAKRDPPFGYRFHDRIDRHGRQQIGWCGVPSSPGDRAPFGQIDAVEASRPCDGRGSPIDVLGIIAGFHEPSQGHAAGGVLRKIPATSRAFR